MKIANFDEFSGKNRKFFRQIGEIKFLFHLIFGEKVKLRNCLIISIIEKKITIFHNFYFFFSGLIGLYPFANVLNLAMMAAFLLLMTWSYVKYSGNFSEIGSTIDELSMTIWDSAIQPTFSKVAEESANYAARQAVQRLNSTSNPPPAMSVKKKQWNQIIRKNSFVVDQIDYIIIGRNGNPINFNLIFSNTSPKYFWLKVLWPLSMERT